MKKSIGKFRHSIASIKIPPKEIEISIFDWAADSLKALYAAEVL